MSFIPLPRSELSNISCTIEGADRWTSRVGRSTLENAGAMNPLMEMVEPLITVCCRFQGSVRDR